MLLAARCKVGANSARDWPRYLKAAETGDLFDSPKLDRCLAATLALLKRTVRGVDAAHAAISPPSPPVLVIPVGEWLNTLQSGQKDLNFYRLRLAGQKPS